MNSLRYLASSLSYRSSPPRPAAADKNEGRRSARSARRSADAPIVEDEKAVARARRPPPASATTTTSTTTTSTTQPTTTKKGDERRRVRKTKEADTSAAETPTRLGIVWRLLGLLMPFLVRESKEARRKARNAERRKHRQTSSTALPPIPRMLIAAKRKTLVLDLDETLIHSMTRGSSSLGPSQMVEVHLKNTQVSSFYYVAKRPHCIDFLQAVLQWYDVAIFTASVQEYADPVIDLLERDLGIYQAFKRRYYRTDCIPDSSGSGGYIKDLTVLGEDLARVMLVDNSAISYVYQQANGIPVEGWISDPSDRALLHLLPLLFALRHTIDVRSVLCLQNAASLIST